MQSPLRQIIKHPRLTHELIVTGAHLSDEFGHSIDEIRSAGFTVDHVLECLLSSDSDVGMAKTIGVATLGLADLLDRIRPDFLLLIADRYEMLAPAAVALALRIPVAHIEGGEISEGAIDDAVRNALTRLAHLHFTPTQTARRRVIAMGEEQWRVHAVGAPSIDTLHEQPLMDQMTLSKQLGISISDSLCVVSLHPVTLYDDTLAETTAVLEALEKTDKQLVFCFPNADAGSRRLIRRARDFCARQSDAKVFVNLSPEVYWALLAQAQMLIGNSSSGIMETPALQLPTVNIGIRQQGRERSINIIDTPAIADNILAAIRQAATPAFRQTLVGMTSSYGDGKSGARIAQALATAPDRKTLLHKRALPLASDADGNYFFEQT